MSYWLIIPLYVTIAIALRIFQPQEFLRRIDRSVLWFASFFGDPVTPWKASITRLCGFLSTLAAIWCAVETFRFARANTGATGVIGILAGLTGTLLTAAAAKFFLRTEPGGASAPVDNQPQPVTGGDITIKQEIKK